MKTGEFTVEGFLSSRFLGSFASRSANLKIYFTLNFNYLRISRRISLALACYSETGKSWRDHGVIPTVFSPAGERCFCGGAELLLGSLVRLERLCDTERGRGGDSWDRVP